MNKIKEIRENNTILQKEECNCLENNINLGKNIELLCITGSKGYGTDTEDSDTDIRGFAIRQPKDIIIGKDWENEEYNNNNMDIVIYSADKFLKLLGKGSPNMVELLGMEEYLHIGDMGQYVLDNKQKFITKQLFKPFKGMIKSHRCNLKGILSNYNKLPSYSNELLVHKNLMNTARLYMEIIDILKTGTIHSRRNEEELKILRSLRLDYKWIIEKGYEYKINPLAYELFDEKEEEMKALIEKSSLPDKISEQEIEDMIFHINDITLYKAYHNLPWNL